MFLDQEREEYEAIQREEALKRIQSLMKRYGITAADLVSLLPPEIEQAVASSEQPTQRRFDPFFDAW